MATNSDVSGNYYSTEEFNREFSSPGTSFSVIHMNIRSIKNKTDELTLFLESFNERYDILAFSETWVTNPDNAPRLNGYRSEHLCRKTKRGGGLAVYFKEELTSEVLHDFSFISADVECLAVRLSKLIVLLLYRPPQGRKRNFLEFFEMFLSSSICEKHSYVVLGDINIDLWCSDNYAKELNALLCTYDAANLIHVPTRLTTHSATLLDICATNMRPYECRSGVLSCDLSDHLPIFFLIPSFATNEHVNNERVYFRRKITNEALGIFVRSIESVDWNPVYLQCDAENAYDVFEGILMDCLCAAFPLEKCTS